MYEDFVNSPELNPFYLQWLSSAFSVFSKVTLLRAETILLLFLVTFESASAELNQGETS